jgi:cell wall-active antibiotic response 4TMS protein YvqF/B-box zinc finger protein
MNCQNHPDVAATAYCRSCGKPVCNECRRDAYGTVFCAEHAPAAQAAPEPPPATAPPPPPPGVPPPGYPPPVYRRSGVSPGLALFLGFIPGVGAIYNGQYAKGLVHAVIFGLLVSISSSNSAIQPLFGILVATWVFYMAFEAYHTARKREMGAPVDEYSSILNLGGRPENAPVTGIVLVALGIVLLLHTLNLFDFEYLLRYWPVLLIILGAYLLFARFTGHRTPEKEMGHER